MNIFLPNSNELFIKKEGGKKRQAYAMMTAFYQLKEHKN